MKQPKLRLVVLQARHVTPTWLRWLKDPVTRKWIFAAKKTRTLNDLRRTVEEWTENPNVMAYAIEGQWKRGVWVHIGNVKADLHEDEETGEQWATIGILMAPETRGVGFGTLAIKKVVRRLRYTWNLTRVDAGIHSRNWPSLRAFERAGFTIDYPPQLWAVREFK